MIIFNNKGQCAFKFEIGLHLDDKSALDFIHKELGIGKVWTRDNKAFFTVIRQNEINCLIQIFTQYPLKSTKGLNFLDFKKAFELYTSSKSKSSKEMFNEIGSIKKNMNSLRTNYDMRDYYINFDLKINAYWLLGFIEAEGSFFVIKRGAHNITMEFSLTQSFLDLSLMEAIKEFFNKLAANPEGSTITDLSFAAKPPLRG